MDFKERLKDLMKNWASGDLHSVFYIAVSENEIMDPENIAAIKEANNLFSGLAKIKVNYCDVCLSKDPTRPFRVEIVHL